MVNDYARKSYPKKRKVKKTTRPFSLYLLIFFLFVLFCTGLYYKTHQTSSLKQNTPQKNNISKNSPGSKVRRPTNLINQTRAPEGPVFEFYNLLSNGKNTTNKEIPLSKINKETYYLQVSALQDQKEADRLKAKLLLLGFDVTIKSQTINKITWFRINLGPYANVLALHQDQKRLRENNINSILQGAQP